MFIGYCRAEFFIPHSRSLKDRRSVVSRIKQRIRNKFNVSVAEKPSDKWQRCELAFSCVNYTKDRVEGMLNQIEEALSACYDIQILDVAREIL